jgi:hypothetical protein
MNRTLSTREKNLVTIVSIALFLFANFLLIDWCWKTNAGLRADIATKSKQLRMVRMLTGDLALWEQRDAWVQASQPHLTNPDTAGVELLDRVKQLAKKHEVLLDNLVIRVPERQDAYVSIAIEVETKSAWKPLVDFLYELQRPDQFIALESSNLKIDAADPAQMRGRFRVAQWYSSRGTLPASL